MPTMSLAAPLFGVKSAGVRFWPKPTTAYIAELAWKAAHLGLTGRSVLCVALRANGYMAGIENHRPVVELEIEMVSSKVTRLGDRWILVRQVYYDRC
jgi:hypothetical protein